MHIWPSVCCSRFIQKCCALIAGTTRQYGRVGGFESEKVVLKIIKHYQEEGRGSEVVQGVLLGLVVDDRLEITNCFPFPQHTEDDADFDEDGGTVALLGFSAAI
ncbi:eukaryotic translation initiation factor 3 subunit H [Tachysurus ichikawai]